MIKRIVGAFLVILYFVLLFLFPLRYSKFFFWFLALGASYEILNIFKFKVIDFLFVLICSFFLFDKDISAYFFAYSIFIFFSFKIVIKDKIENDFILKSFLVIFYSVFPLYFLYLLFLDNKHDVLFLILGIWLYDTAAYLVGIKFGKHKMSPNISPKKSYEGLIGASLIVLAVFFKISLIYGAYIIFLAPLGDLVMSVLKRNYGIKDFSSIIPGHGGILDRIDSFTFLFPMIYLLKGVF
jgi:phosphatidate cytidylyltransferase